MPVESKPLPGYKVQSKRYEVSTCRSLNPPFQLRNIWLCVENNVDPSEIGWTGYQIAEAGNAGKFPIGTKFSVKIEIPKK